MRSNHVKKLLISSVALSLLLGGSPLYAAGISADPSTSETQLQQNTAVESEALHFHRGHEHGDFPVLDETATILGIDKEEIKKSLKEGKSLVEIASNKGVSEADLTAKLLKLRSDKLDQAVKSGKLEASKASKMKQHMTEHLKFMLNEKDLLDKHGRNSMGKFRGAHPDPEKLAQVIGITKDELITQLKAGKSIAEIAAAKGISRAQLVNKIKDQMTPSIEQMVDRKRDKKAE
jgi:hypothetical protein